MHPAVFGDIAQAINITAALKGDIQAALPQSLRGSSNKAKKTLDSVRCDVGVNWILGSCDGLWAGTWKRNDDTINSRSVF